MNCLCHCANAFGSRPRVQWSAGRDMIRLGSGETAKFYGVWNEAFALVEYLEL